MKDVVAIIKYGGQLQLKIRHGRKAKKRSSQLSNLVTVEVHCCIVSLIRKELSEEITAEIHLVV